ncbi:MAG TPA: ABC transporter ATP-binding protein [Clostridiales bacterium]|nr:ABC transporter ATP-binding protein [Clostridiales bacterium]
MLRIFSASKSYAKSTFKAVDNLTLHVKKGVIYGFIGPNGAGKTTTIKMLTGILPFEEGNIEINGFDIKRDPINAKKSIGFVPDNHVIYEKLTGREYINFMADIYRVDLAERKRRAEKYLEMFNLTKDVDSQISSYSHGMKQKICVIGALIHNPPLWVLDEPLTGLDPQSSFELKNLMREHTKQGNTVFFSTHVLEVAEKLCDRIGIINKGKLILEGTMDEIKAMGGKDESLEQIFIKITNQQNIQI